MNPITVTPDPPLRGPLGEALARQKQSPHRVAGGRGEEEEEEGVEAHGEGREVAEEKKDEYNEHIIDSEAGDDVEGSKAQSEPEVSEDRRREGKVSSLSVSGGRILAHRWGTSPLPPSHPRATGHSPEREKLSTEQVIVHRELPLAEPEQEEEGETECTVEHLEPGSWGAKEAELKLELVTAAGVEKPRTPAVGACSRPSSVCVPQVVLFSRDSAGHGELALRKVRW